MNNALKLTIPALMLSLLAACASTELSYSPEESDGFKFDPDSSFAMNVVEGSLGFHNGLSDSEVSEDASSSPTAINYAGDAYLGLMSNGIGGALLGLLGSNYGSYPLNTGYGIFYVPVQDHSKASIAAAYEYVNQSIIHAVNKGENMSFSFKQRLADGHMSFIFEGDRCLKSRTNPEYQRLYTQRYIDYMGLTKPNQCEAAGYYKLALMRFSQVTPDKQQGDFAVIGIQNIRSYTSFEAIENMGNNFYFFQPSSRTNPAPYVFHGDKAWFFITPVEGTSPTDASRYSVPLSEMKKKYPKYFGLAQ